MSSDNSVSIRFQNWTTSIGVEKHFFKLLLEQVLNKEIKELEKYKAKTEKVYEKMTGKAKEEVIDESSTLESDNYNLNIK